MLKIIRNNQKKFVAGLAAVSMVMFVYTGRSGSDRSGRDDRAFGTVAGGSPLMASDVNGALQELSAVNQYARQFEYQEVGPQGASLVDLLLGRDVAQLVTHKPELFALLRREAAAAAGGPVDPQRVKAFMDARLGGTGPTGQPIDVPTPNTDAYDLIQAGVADLLLVHDNFARVTTAFKASGPAVDHSLATVEQTIQLNLIPVPADAMSAQVKPPTPAQLDAQFKAFADVAADHPDPVGNPFGFGYRSPVRVRLQYLRVTRESLEKSVVDTKSAYEWDVAARKRFYADRKATAAPGTPTSQPTATDVADALKAVRVRPVQEKQDAVQQYLTATLNRDYQTYAAGLTPTTGPAAAAYQNLDYLRGLVDQVQAKFAVHVDLDETKDLTGKAVNAIPGLGTAAASLSAASSSSSSPADGTLPGFVLDRATAYLSKPDPKPPAATVDLLRPSAAFTEGYAEPPAAIDFVRVVAVKPSAAAADLESVHLAVDADCRTVAAYDLAKAQADKLIATAKDGSLAAAVLAAGRQAIPTQPLTLQSTSVDGLRPPLEDAAPDFLKQAFGLLSTYNPTTNRFPLTVIALPAQRRLFVAQLQFVNARWTADTYYQARLATAAALQQNMVGAARLAWFSPSAIAQRTGFKPLVGPSGS